MGGTLSYGQLRMVLVGILPLFHLLFHNFEYSAMVMYIPLCVILACRLLRRGLTLKRSYWLFIGGMMAVYVVCTFNSGYTTATSLAYIGLILLFLLALPEMGEAFADYPMPILVMWTVIIGLMLLPRVWVEADSITPSRILQALRINDPENLSKVRAEFGFTHANTAGYLLATNIIVLCKLLNMGYPNKIAKPLRYLLWADMALSIWGMLATGSRAASLAIFILMGMLLYTRFLDRLNRQTRFLLKAAAFLLVAYVLIGRFVLRNLVANSSGRDVNVLAMVKALYESGNLFFGVGLAPISSGLLSRKLGAHFVIDGWYQYMLGCVGVVGLVCILLLLVYIVKYCLRHTPAENYDFALALVVCFALYGTAENITLTPGVLLSVVAWVLLYGGSLPGKQRKKATQISTPQTSPTTPPYTHDTTHRSSHHSHGHAQP